MVPITGLRQLLLNTANVTAVTSNVMSIPAPADLSQYPLITYQQISLTRDYALPGSIGIDQSRIAFNCFSSSYAETRALVDAVIEAFDGFNGTLPDGTQAYTQVITEDDGYDTNNQLAKATVQIYCFA